MFRFANPQWLWLLTLVPALLWAGWFVARSRRPVVSFSATAHLEGLAFGVRRRLRWLPAALRALALACLIGALARPQFGQGEVRTTTRGVAMIFVIDRSASMNEPFAFDGRQTTKMDAVKDVVTRFIRGDGDLKGREGDMIGLVSFAKFADTVCPLVRSHDTLVGLVNQMQLVGATMAEPEAGTAIGEGLALGAARLRDVERELSRRSQAGAQPSVAAGTDSAGTASAGTASAGPSAALDIKADDTFSIKSKVIVLLTDGEENMGEITAAQAAELCRQWGIKVYAIGVGAGGGRQPVQQRLANGMVIMRSGAGFDDRPLREVAKVTGGQYFAANDPKSLANVYAEIDRLEKTEIKSQEFTNYDEKFGVLAAAAGALLAAQALLGATFLRRGP